MKKLFNIWSNKLSEFDRVIKNAEVEKKSGRIGNCYLFYWIAPVISTKNALSNGNLQTWPSYTNTTATRTIREIISFVFTLYFILQRNRRCHVLTRFLQKPPNTDSYNRNHALMENTFWMYENISGFLRTYLTRRKRNLCKPHTDSRKSSGCESPTRYRFVLPPSTDFLHFSASKKCRWLGM